METVKQQSGRVGNNGCITLWDAVDEAKQHYTMDMIPQVDVTIMTVKRLPKRQKRTMDMQWYNNSQREKNLITCIRGMSRSGTGSTTNLTNSTKFSLTAVENKSFADHDSLVHRLKLMKKLMVQLQHQRCMVQIIKESSNNHLQFKNYHTLHGFDSIMKIVRQLRSKVKTPGKQIAKI